MARSARGLLAFLLIATLCCLPLAARSEEDPPTPMTLKGAKVVDAQAAKAVAEAGKAAIFDTRKPLNYEKGHLKGAVSLPYDQKSEKKADFDASKDKVDLGALPKDKARTLLFYSDGPTGWKSYKIAAIAVQKGYTDVLWFRGGTAEWIAKGFPLE